MFITAQNVEDWHNAGPTKKWWYNLDDQQYYFMSGWDQPSENSLYLMAWDNAWFNLWGGDWQAAADNLNGQLIEMGMGGVPGD